MMKLRNNHSIILKSKLSGNKYNNKKPFGANF